MTRPDFSNYVVHFTRSGQPFGNPAQREDEEARHKQVTAQDAYERLVSILEKKTIWASRMPWTNAQAVCFTECTWASLLDHARHYSPFGIGFSKAFLFSRDGGPAVYLRPDIFTQQEAYVKTLGGQHAKPFDHKLWSFITPFAPPYAHPGFKTYWDKQPVDYTHEREWRVPHELPFDYQHVSFVIVDTYNDLAKVPKEFKDAIGRDKFLIMDNYRKVEELWPTHLL